MALRDHACLVWGAVDLGPGSSGDIMHFDCRLDDLGGCLLWNGRHLQRQPSMLEALRIAVSSSHRKTKESTDAYPGILDSECEDDSVAELEEFAEEQSVEYFADPDNEFRAELEETEELDESEDFLDDQYLAKDESAEEELEEAFEEDELASSTRSRGRRGRGVFGTGRRRGDTCVGVCCRGASRT